MTGRQACEGHQHSYHDCMDLGCCTWDSYDGSCWSQVGDDMCRGNTKHNRSFFCVKYRFYLINQRYKQIFKMSLNISWGLESKSRRIFF